MNALMIIQPYRKYDTWVFDDEARGLKAEPFVEGIPEIIDRILKVNKIKREDKFNILFSAEPFEGWQAVLNWEKKGEQSGNWYTADIYDKPMRGWLCPALFKFFKEAPKKLYTKMEKVKK